MKTYNEDIKVLADLENRYVNVVCHGGYGNNPSVTMLSNKSTIQNGFIKKVDVKFICKDENGENKFKRTLHIDSEYGHEIRLPYDKIVAIDILSSSEQAQLEMYNRKKDHWNAEIERLIQLTGSEENVAIVEIANELIHSYKSMLKKGEELVEKGVKTFK